MLWTRLVLLFILCLQHSYKEGMFLARHQDHDLIVSRWNSGGLNVLYRRRQQYSSNAASLHQDGLKQHSNTFCFGVARFLLSINAEPLQRNEKDNGLHQRKTTRVANQNVLPRYHDNAIAAEF